MARSSGRAATKGVIEGSIALSVGRPSLPEPIGWRWTELGTVARLESGHTPSRRHPEWWGGDIPWIGIKDATSNHGREVSETVENTNEDGIANSSARVLPKDTVCVSRTASVGYVIMMGRPMATSQDFANWVCSDKINPHFLKYVFLLENAALKRFSYGTTHQTIYYPELKAFHVCLPDRAEQDRIVAVLKSLDDKIEMNRQMCATLEEMARALYRSWFVDFDPVRAREIGQTPAFMDDATVALFPDRFGEDGLPEGWRKQPYNDLIELVSGGTPQTSREEYWGGSIPWYSVVDMPRDGIFVINTEKAITDLGLKNSPARLLEKGDSIISARGTVGKIAMVGAPMAFNQSCYGLRGKNKGIGSAFVFLATSNAVEDLKSRAHGSVFSTITRSTFDGLTLTADDGAILPAFEARLAPLLGRMLNAQLEACTLASLRDTLLPKLMSGEIRLREAEAQVEEVM